MEALTLSLIALALAASLYAIRVARANRRCARRQARRILASIGFVHLSLERVERRQRRLLKLNGASETETEPGSGE